MTPFPHDGHFMIGANYWESVHSINMWEQFSPDIIDRDFERLAGAGIRVLRMFLLWPQFQPLKAIWANARLYELRFTDESPLPDTEAGQAGVSEAACEKFAVLCRLAEKHGIRLIVGLLTGHMSFRFYMPPAFEGRNFLEDPEVIKWEVRFVRYFVKRFRGEPSILAWDLGNECNGYRVQNKDQAYVWMQCIASAIRLSDPDRPIVSGFDRVPLDADGGFHIRDTAELVDVQTTHPYYIFTPCQIDPINTIRPCIAPAVSSTLYETIGGKPCFIEEIGSIGYANCSETTEAAYLNTLFWSAFAQNCGGVFWWCAFDQGQLTYAPYDWNNYGSDYGFFRADGSEKKIVEISRRFDRFLADFPYANLPRHTEEAVVIVPRELREHAKTLESAYILAKQANFDVRFAHAEEKLPDAQLYIMPSIPTSKPMFLRRLNELLDRVRAGAVLYFSLGNTLFRRFPELTGLTVSTREKVGADTVTFDGEEFPFYIGFRQNIESVAEDCEVLATLSDGTPAFVRHAYGKGSIYFCAFPLETLLGDQPKAFCDGAKPYYRFYEAFSRELTKNRAVTSSDKTVLLTEHPIDGERRIIIAVNYAPKDAVPDLICNTGWKIVRYHHGGKVISANDAAVLEVIRETK